MAVNWQAKRSKSFRKFGSQGVKTLGNPSVGNVALLAYRGVKALRAIVNSEVMVIDVAYTATTSANSPLVTHLNPITQGDGISQRTGQSCLMSNIHLKELVSTAAAGALCREVLIMDRQQISDTAPSWTDVFESASPFSYYNKNTKGRFQILEDKTYILNQVQNSHRYRSVGRKLQKHATYNGTAGTDIQKNGIYKLFISDAVCSVNFNGRLTFHDN